VRDQCGLVEHEVTVISFYINLESLTLKMVTEAFLTGAFASKAWP